MCVAILKLYAFPGEVAGYVSFGLERLETGGLLLEAAE